MGKNNRNFVVLAVVIVLLIVGVVMTNNTGASMKPEEARAIAGDFVNDVLMGGQGGSSIEEVSLYEPKVYALKIKLEGSEEMIDSYISADGKLFFPQSLDIEELAGDGEETAGDTATPEPVAEAPKPDRPNVEIFVMSHCPYGTQIEKGIMPVAAALANDIDFEVKFVDYAMHGQKEIDEQILQYCIQEEQNDKFANYLNCFLEDGDTDRCLGVAGINQDQANNCADAVDAEHRITEVFVNKEGWSNYPPFPIHANENQQYGVQGSPTLVINGEQVRASRDSASLAAVICGAFNTAPEACNQEFSTAAPAPGFGSGTASASTDVTCN